LVNDPAVSSRIKKIAVSGFSALIPFVPVSAERDKGSQMIFLIWSDKQRQISLQVIILFPTKGNIDL
jgi:hypothetical protein